MLQNLLRKNVPINVRYLWSMYTEVHPPVYLCADKEQTTVSYVSVHVWYDSVSGGIFPDYM